MAEHPILFSGDMVRAILAGRKTQTRRVVEHPEYHGCLTGDCPHQTQAECDEDVGRWARNNCPYGVPGDRLWVRETWTSGYQDGGWGTIFRSDKTFALGKRQHAKGPHFHAREIGPHIRWRPSIHMPRWASRITLEITEIHVERVQDISEEDAMVEGVDPIGDQPGFIGSFAETWDSLYAKRGFGWSENPFVWVVEFKVVEVRRA